MEVKDYYAVLSGEHRTLPLAELRAIIESEGIYARELARLDMVVIIESSRDLLSSISRAALVKYFGELIGVCEADSDIAGFIKDIDWSSVLAGKEYLVSMLRIKEYSSWVKYDDVLNAFKSLNVGRPIPYGRAKSSGVDNLKQAVIDLILSDGLLVIGKRLYERNYNDFRSRDPKNRPVYKPGTMKSLMSRVFVNLSRVSMRRRGLYLDPFCGVGGMLLEACSMGLRYCGSDLDPRSVSGAKTNLTSFSCVPNVVVADACRLPFRSVDGVGTDPPYGRLSRAKGRRWVYELMECSVQCLAEVVKRGGYLTIAQSSDVRLDEILARSGFKVVEKHYNWVHGSLTRNIYVAVRP